MKENKFPILAFLRGDGKTTEGLSIHDIWEYTDEELEQNHHFIQWIFPGRKRSFYNLKAPVLTDEELKRIKEDPKCMESILKSFRQMMSFWERKVDWNVGTDHNYLRMTRAYLFLRECDLMPEAIRLEVFMKHLMLVNEQIMSSGTYRKWNKLFN